MAVDSSPLEAPWSSVSEVYGTILLWYGNASNWDSYGAKSLGR